MRNQDRVVRKYQIVDATGQEIAEPFDKEREAYEAKKIYADHCFDIALPLKVVPIVMKGVER